MYDFSKEKKNIAKYQKKAIKKKVDYWSDKGKKKKRNFYRALQL